MKHPSVNIQMSSINLQTPIIYPSVVFFSIRIVTIKCGQCLCSVEHLNNSSRCLRYIYPGRTGVDLQCPTVHNADTLQYMESTCSGGCNAAYIQPTLYIHFRYTSGALQFDLGIAHISCSMQYTAVHNIVAMNF